MQQVNQFEGVNLIQRQCKTISLSIRSDLFDLESVSDSETRKKRSATLADQIDYSISSDEGGQTELHLMEEEKKTSNDEE
jgi:hypothetical protein